MPRLDQLLRDAARRIDGTDAALLLAHALGQPRSWLYAHGDDEVDAATAARFESLVARREGGEPIAYLTGTRGFWKHEFRVTPDTLIPRPETERLVELALERLPPGEPLRIADLGTGSGAIALALALERPRAQVVATDASAGALEVAQANAARLGAGNVEFRQGSWFEPLAGERFDVVVGNPPYVAAGDPHLARGDLRFEPASALASGGDGLEDLRAIVRDAPSHLLPGGWLLLEHGFDQGEAVRGLLQARGFTGATTARDLEDRDRVALGQWSGPLQ